MLTLGGQNYQEETCVNIITRVEDPSTDLTLGAWTEEHTAPIYFIFWLSSLLVRIAVNFQQQRNEQYL